MSRSYSAFLDALGKYESGDNYSFVSSPGYLGKYQFGEAALTDLGFYKGDSTPSTNDWAGQWTGKDGIHSKAQFLASPSAQEDAIHEFMGKQFGYIAPIAKYAGQTIDGVHLTISGLLAGANLVGAPVEIAYLQSGEKGPSPTDGFGTPVTKYMTLFSGYETPFKVDHSGAEKLVGSSGHDVLEGHGGNDRLVGGAGNDRIAGGTGHNTLTGGAGSDQFVFHNASNDGATITDFAATGRAHDEIVLHLSGFGVSANSIPLVNGLTDSGTHAQLLYDSANGHLFLDTNGSEAGGRMLIAALTDHPAALHQADFVFT